MFEPDLNLDSAKVEAYDIDLFEWSSAAATLTLGDLGQEMDTFNPIPLKIRETGENSGIFQMILSIPVTLQGMPLADGELINLGYTDWGVPAGRYVGNQSEDKDVVISAISTLSTVSFVSSSSVADQESGIHSVKLRLDVVGGGITAEDISVEVIDAGSGTATEGSDYRRFSPKNVLFPAGSVDGDILEITIEILPDVLEETDETIDLRLTGIIASLLAEHTIRIDDDDSGVLRVDHSADGDATGKDWPNAFTSLQDALDMAEKGDEIWIAAGIYTPDVGERRTLGSRRATFRIMNNVSVFGGFKGSETRRDQRDWSLNKTILSGDLNGDDTLNFVNYDENSYSVVTCGNDCFLDGVTITAANSVGRFGNSGISCSRSANGDHCQLLHYPKFS